MARFHGNQNVTFQVQAGRQVATVLEAVRAHHLRAAKHRDSAKRADDSRFPGRPSRPSSGRISTRTLSRGYLGTGGECPTGLVSRPSMSWPAGRELPAAIWAALVLSRA